MKNKKTNPFKKNPFPLFAILTMVGIGIYVSYIYVQSLVKDISLTIGIMAGSTVIFLSLFLFSTKWAMESVIGGVDRKNCGRFECRVYQLSRYETV